MTGSPVATVLTASALAAALPRTFFCSPRPGWHLPLSVSVLRCHFVLPGYPPRGGGASQVSLLKVTQLASHLSLIQAETAMFGIG